MSQWPKTPRVRKTAQKRGVKHDTRTLGHERGEEESLLPKPERFAIRAKNRAGDHEASSRQLPSRDPTEAQGTRRWRTRRRFTNPRRLLGGTGLSVSVRRDELNTLADEP